jgi:hypothetical protein
MRRPPDAAEERGQGLLAVVVTAASALILNSLFTELACNA